jgi:ABC-type Fe3+ transport system permease subunit
MLLVLAVAGTLIWVLFDQGLINLSNPTVNTWIGIAVLSVVLAIGLSWSIVRRTLQVNPIWMMSPTSAPNTRQPRPQ